MKSVEREELETRIRTATPSSGVVQFLNTQELTDGTVLKVFRSKRGLTSSVFRSYARRFVRATHQLRDIGVPTVEVIDAFHIDGLGRDGVIYRPLPGRDLRDLASSSPFPEDVMTGFAGFMTRLHERGVYFRGLHLGNVIVDAAGAFGLIDVSDLTVDRAALGVAKRVRNFRPMLRYPEDRAALQTYGPTRFAQAYLSAGNLSDRAHAAFVGALAECDPLFSSVRSLGRDVLIR